MPIFREIMLRVYKDKLVGPAPKFPREIEDGIDTYLALQARGDTPRMPADAAAVAMAPALVAPARQKRTCSRPQLVGIPFAHQVLMPWPTVGN